MKHRPVCTLLMATASLAANAHPIFRCDDGLGHISFQSRACPLAKHVTAQDETAQSHPPAGAQKAVFKGSFMAFETDPTPQAPPSPILSERQSHRHQNDAEQRRLQLLLQTLNIQRDAEYAASRARCENAMRIAAICGKYSGRFYCDDKGFRAVPAEQAPPMQPALNARDALSMEQCARQASR